jgi:hypothetical protein
MSYPDPDENYPDFFRLIKNVGLASGVEFSEHEIYEVIEPNRAMMFASPVRRIGYADRLGIGLLLKRGITPIEQRRGVE